MGGLENTWDITSFEVGAIIFLAKYDVFARRPGAQKIECDKAEIVCQGKNSAFASLFHRYKKVDIL